MRAVVITPHRRPDGPAGAGAARSRPPARGRCASTVRRGGGELRRHAGAHRRCYADAPPLPARRRLRGGRRRSPRWGRASTRRASATASWPARASAATPSRSSSPQAPTRSRCPTTLTLRAGRGDPGQLRDRLGGAARLRQRCARASACSSTRPPAASASPRTQLAKPARRRGLRHGVAAASTTRSGRARASTVRSTTAATAGGGGLGPLDLVLDAIGGPSFQRSYEPAAPRAAGSSPSAPRRSRPGREAHAATRAARRALRDAARLQPHRADAASRKAVIGLNMLRLWDDRGTLDAVDRAAARADRRRHGPPGRPRGRPVRPRGRRAPDPRRAPQRRQGRAGAVTACCVPRPVATLTFRVVPARPPTSPPPPLGGNSARGGRLKPRTHNREVREHEPTEEAERPWMTRTAY